MSPRSRVSINMIKTVILLIIKIVSITAGVLLGDGMVVGSNNHCKSDFILSTPIYIGCTQYSDSPIFRPLNFVSREPAIPTPQSSDIPMF